MSNVADLTARELVDYLTEHGHPAEVEYQGHGLVSVIVPLDEEYRVLVHSWSGPHTEPDTAQLDTEESLPGVAIERESNGSLGDVVMFPGDFPDPPQLWASLTRSVFLEFTEHAVRTLTGRYRSAR